MKLEDSREDWDTPDMFKTKETQESGSVLCQVAEGPSWEQTVMQFHVWTRGGGLVFCFFF